MTTATSEKKSGDGLAVLFITLATLAIGLPLRGWATKILWQWFVVEQFQFPALSLMHAIGLSILISHLTGSIRKPSKSEDALDSALWGFVTCLFAPILGLIFGGLVHAMM
jgi:hypothetical protein